jgi:hypothetical protein
MPGAGLGSGFGAGIGVGFGAGRPTRTGARGAGYASSGTPLTILGSSLKGWWDFSDASLLFQLSNGTTAVTADADPIGYATDKSGNGNHIVQATAGKRPAYKVNIQNSKSVARPDGVDDFLAMAGALSLGTSHTIHLAYKAKRSKLVLGGATDNYPVYSDGTGRFYDVGGTVATVATPFTDGVWACMTIVRSGTTVQFWENGVQIGTDQTLGANTALSIQGVMAYTDGTFSYNADVGEIVISNIAESLAQHTAVCAYLNSRWAMY